MSLFSASQAKNDRTILLDLLTSLSNKTLANCLRTRSRYCLGTSFGNCTINSWKGTIIPKTQFNMGVVCARNFSTGSPPASREPVTIVSMSKEFTKYFWQQRNRFFRNTAITMDCGYGKKPPYSDTPCGSGSSNVRQNPIQQPGPCRQPYERRKPCPPLERCVRARPPCCRPRPKNHKCPKLPQPCPPPCPIPCPKPLEKPPAPKICYRKCPPLPKLPKLPTCRKIPAPPPPPPLPRLPKLPKCPPLCPPPSPPPLPTCPKPPRCPECPPQRECPPPPPCEPCPCPLPCPPPCCPPPPPCPPCPLPIPCPKPLPCPLPPPARVCPPCPPCPEHPKPPPCPPPPPCCPCPCPEPPPVCPCPKPCPPCPQIVEPSPSCPDDLSSCPKSNNPLNIKTRKMSTYRWPLLPFGDVPSRGLRVASVLPGKSDKSDKYSNCKSLTDICQDKKDSTCLKRCERKPDCDTKRKPCTDQLNNVTNKTNKKKKKKKELCSDSCIPKGKCDQPRVPAPPKMQYGAVKCPTPKFVSPKPCPDVPEPASEPDDSCTELRSANKPKKEVCVPPPLPKPPTKPVVLCPCPPPPKMHPGPCPCQEMKQEPPQKITVQPCSVKEKYVCPLEPHYCPQEKTICRRDKTCDPNKRKNKKKK